MVSKGRIKLNVRLLQVISHRNSRVNRRRFCCLMDENGQKIGNFEGLYSHMFPGGSTDQPSVAC